MAIPGAIISKRYVVVLKLAKLSIPGLIERARNYVFKMTENVYFPIPHPPLPAVTDSANVLEQAWEAAQDGSRSQTQIMYQRREALINLLVELGHYVDDTANDQLNPPAVIVSAGMYYRTVPHRLPRAFHVRNGSLKGNVIAVAPKAANRASYIWQYRLKGASTWIIFATTVKASTIITGLASGSTYEFRMASVTRAGQGDWTDELELVVL